MVIDNNKNNMIKYFNNEKYNLIPGPYLEYSQILNNVNVYYFYVYLFLQLSAYL